jgi:ABC-type transport system involved in multi-copper enzyme maturation permease subunit
MYNLIRKDLILNKKFLLVFGFLYIVYMGYLGSRVSTPREVVIFSTLLCALLPLIQYTREDKFKTSVLNSSLPVTRRQIVLSRYVLSWAVTLIMYALIIAALAVIPGGKVSAAALLNFTTILFALAFMTLYLSLLLPPLLRFGMVGMFAFLIGIQVLAIPILVLERHKVVNFGLRDLASSIKSALFSLQAHLGQSGYLALIIVLLILLNTASFFWAVFLFKRKDL